MESQKYLESDELDDESRLFLLLRDEDLERKKIQNVQSKNSSTRNPDFPPPLHPYNDGQQCMFHEHVCKLKYLKILVWLFSDFNYLELLLWFLPELDLVFDLERVLDLDEFLRWLLELDLARDPRFDGDLDRDFFG